MASADRREREKMETRDRIMTAARELFVRDGAEAVTMRAIAERIEYTPTAIYHHFRDKQSLLEELCHTDFMSLAGTFNAIGPIADPVERLRRIGEAYLTFAAQFPAQYEFMFMTRRPDVPPRDGEKDNPQQNAYLFLLQSISAGIEQGRFREGLTDAEQIAQMIWPSLHGVIALQRIRVKDEWVEWRDLETTCGLVMDALFRGILRDPSDAEMYQSLKPLTGAIPDRPY